MNLKNNKIIKVSALASILSVGILASGYTALNKDIKLVVKDEEKIVTTFKPNVKEFLEEQEVEYDSNDIISLDLDAKLSDGVKVEVIDVELKTTKEIKEVPYEVSVVEDKELLKGTTKVETEGSSGENELIYKITYHNGEEVDKEFVEEVVSIEPVTKVIKKGTKVEVKVASSRGESTRGNSTKTTINTQVSKSSTSVSRGESTRKINSTKASNNNVSSNDRNNSSMKVVATAYTGDGITATGTTPKWGTIAVDPSVIPYGTKVYIPQFGQTFIAEDTGGAIKGNKIDIYMDNETKAINWGRKTIDIQIIK